MLSMKQLTVRGFDDELAEAIRQLARRDGTSLNQAALKLLRRGAGLPDGQVSRAGGKQTTGVSKTSINVRLTDQHKCHLSNLRL